MNQANEIAKLCLAWFNSYPTMARYDAKTGWWHVEFANSEAWFWID